MSANAVDSSEHRASSAYSSRFELYDATDADQATVTRWAVDTSGHGEVLSEALQPLPHMTVAGLARVVREFEACTYA